MIAADCHPNRRQTVLAEPKDVPDSREDSAPHGPLTEVGRYGGYGLTIGVATALFAWVGTLLDARLHTKPLFVLLGTFLGFGAAFYSMIRHLQAEPSRRRAPGSAEKSDGNPEE